MCMPAISYVVFCSVFVRLFLNIDIFSCIYRFSHIDDVARTLSLYLSEELACILKYPSTTLLRAKFIYLQ